MWKGWSGMRLVSLQNDELITTDSSCICDDFIFFSSAWFVQQHHPLIRQRGGCSGQCSLTLGCCQCFVTLGRGVRSSVFHIHQPHSFQLEAGSDGLNSFCVIYSEEPAFPYLLWRTGRSWGRCAHPGWPKSCPAPAGHLWLWSLVTALCQALSTSCMQDPLDSDPLCHWSWFWDLAYPFSTVSHSQHKYFPHKVIII